MTSPRDGAGVVELGGVSTSASLSPTAILVHGALDRIAERMFLIDSQLSGAPFLTSVGIDYVQQDMAVIREQVAYLRDVMAAS